MKLGPYDFQRQILWVIINPVQVSCAWGDWCEGLFLPSWGLQCPSLLQTVPLVQLASDNIFALPTLFDAPLLYIQL